MRSRDTVKMQGFELAATLVLPSDFQNFFWGPRRASGDPDKRGNRSVLSPSLRGRVAEQDPCIYQGLCLPEASYPVKMQGFWLRTGPR